MWRVADGGWLYVIEDADRAGHSLVTITLTDLAAAAASALGRSRSRAADLARPQAVDAETAVSYTLIVSEMTATDAREHFSDALATASREPVFITRHGKRIAALVTVDFYDRAVEALEDAEDIAAAHAALEEDGESVPWEVVKAELGLT